MRKGEESTLPVRMGLAIASTLLVLAVGEGAARLLWRPPAKRQPKPLPAAWQALPRVENLFDLAKPNLRAVQRGALFETNSKGFRGPERAETKPPGVFRIVVTGDSYAMGSGVLYEDAFPARIERALSARNDGRTYEVLDIALAGQNTHWAVERLETLGIPFDPDLVIYAFTINDIEGDHYRRSFDASYPGTAGADSTSYLLRWLAPRWRSLRELLAAPRGSYVYEASDNYFHNDNAWRDVSAALGRLATLTRERGVCGVVYVQTQLVSLNVLHPFLSIYDRVADAAVARGLYVADSFEHFRGQIERDLWVNEIDHHPNAEGHRILADALLEGLRQLPSHCGLLPAKSGS